MRFACACSSWLARNGGVAKSGARPTPYIAERARIIAGRMDASDATARTACP
jgi:hypothetical protein